MQASEKRWLFITVCGALAAITLGLAVHFAGFGRAPKDEQAKTRALSKTVHYRFVVRNESHRPVENAGLSIFAPLPQTDYQRCSHIEASHPYATATDENGNRLLHFTFPLLPPYGSKVVSLRARLTLHPTPRRPVNPDRRRVVQPHVAFDWAAREPALFELAQRLKTDEVYTTAAAVHHWVADHLTYSGYASTPKGARYAFRERKGDCTEFADLFVALAQAAGVRARRVSGHYAPAAGLLSPANAHDWAEFCDRGLWRIADPQQATFDENYTDYVALRLHGPAPERGTATFARFSATGDGIRVRMGS